MLIHVFLGIILIVMLCAATWDHDDRKVHCCKFDDCYFPWFDLPSETKLIYIIHAATFSHVDINNPCCLCIPCWCLYQTHYSIYFPGIHVDACDPYHWIPCKIFGSHASCDHGKISVLHRQWEECSFWWFNYNLKLCIHPQFMLPSTTMFISMISIAMLFMIGPMLLFLFVLKAIFMSMVLTTTG